MSKKKRSELMSRIKSVSAMEVRARKIATALAGCRLVHQPKNVYGRPDYGNKARKIVVFVDGCYWHYCPAHGSVPKTNAAFWRKKFKRNIQRRKEVAAVLKSRGWKVLEMWEHKVKK